LCKRELNTFVLVVRPQSSNLRSMLESEPALRRSTNASAQSAHSPRMEIALPEV
jgi:hypothetical protein